MFIKEIVLNNFRIYNGYNQISLLPDEDKNIIIISGQNGFGKTTFLMALVWCLYGKQMEYVDELYRKEIKSKKNYTNYISESLNKEAAAQGESEFYVSITFSDVQSSEIKCNEVVVKRSYNTKWTNDKVEILIDGYKNELIEDLSKDNQRGEDIFIRNFIMPVEIAKFFFFDAEKIVAMADVDSNDLRRQLSQAYSQVLGIQRYEDLKNTLESSLDEYRAKTARLEQRKEFNSLKTSIENSEIEIDELTSEIEEYDELITEKQREAEEIQTKLIQYGEKMTLEELNQLRKGQKEIEAKKEYINNQLRDLYDIIPFALAGGLLGDLYEQLNKEQKVKDNRHLQSNIEDKINDIRNELDKERLNCKFSIDVIIQDFYNEQLQKLIRKHFFTEIEDVSNIEILHDFSSEQGNEIKQLINRLKNSFKTQFEKLHADFSTLKYQYDSINREIKEAEKNEADEYITKLRTERELNTAKITDCTKKIGSIEEQIRTKKDVIKADKQKLEDVRKTIDDATQYADKEQKTKKIISTLQSFIKQFKLQKKKSLEEKMYDSLHKLLHKKHLVSGVDITISTIGDDIDIALKGANGKLLDKGQLSMGERQMYASALLQALVSESEIEFPVFIDSPMQKFDESHSHNVIKYFYPEVSKQVIIFPLINKELIASEYKELLPKICKTYLINNEEEKGSSFLEVLPNELLEVYKKKYNAN